MTHLSQIQIGPMFINCQNLNSTSTQANLTWQYLSISGISKLLLTRIWPNFKGMFLGPFWTDSNCHNDICPGNICPGNKCHSDICPRNICPCDICPYQEYLSCYWPDFDQTLKVDSWDNLELISTVMATFFQAMFVLATAHIRNISAVTDMILTKLQK